MKHVLTMIYFSICFTFLFMRPVHAYIDPSVMTYAIQAVAGIAIALGTVVGIYWRKILKIVRRIFGIRKVKSKNLETNDLVFNDDKNNCKITPATYSKEEVQILTKRKLIVGSGSKTEIVKEEKGKLNIKGRLIALILELLPGVLLSAALSFMLCYYAPLEMYMNNQDEFWFDYNILSIEISKMTIILFGIMILLVLCIYLINKRVYRGVLVAGLVSLVVLYIHGNYYCSVLPAMDGTEINWENYLYQIRNSIIICLIVMFVVLLLFRILKHKKFYYFADFICILIVCMLSVLLFDITNRTNGKVEKQYDYMISTMNEFDYSETSNFIIFVVDAYDAETFMSLLDLHPEYSEIFDGFSLYPDTVSAYPFTSRSIPFILSGQWYENQTDFKEFEAQAVNQSLLLNTLVQQQYRLDMYEDEFLFDTDMGRYSNSVSTEPMIDDAEQFRKDILTMSLYKYSPYFWKKNFEVDVTAVNSNIRTVDNIELFSMNNLQFFEKVNEQSITTTNQKVFKFIHLEGAHVPFNYDENMNVIESGTYEQKEMAVVTLLDQYFKKLKQSGVYDNSTIVIMGDHGYDPTGESIERRCNALMMIKSAGESGSLVINDTPVSYDDLQGMYQNLLNGNSGENAFEGLAEDNSERRFLSHTWTNENILTEYLQTGYASDITTMIPTGNQYITDDLSNNEGQ